MGRRKEFTAATYAGNIKATVRGRHFAMCDCGWCGKVHDSAKVADDELEAHRAEGKHVGSTT